jgi:hypothetical protein
VAEPSKTKGTWHRSSYSEEKGNCVEVRLSHVLLVRDSRNDRAGTLVLHPVEWMRLVTALSAAPTS